MIYGIPIVLKEGAKTQEGKNAINENINAIKAISEAIKPIYGPYGLGKVLIDKIGDITISKDCYTILEELEVEHPAAKMVIELAKTLNKNCGDGVARSIIFLGELLKLGNELIEQGIHPNIVLSGFKKSIVLIKKHIDSIKTKINLSDEEKLKDISSTTLNTKNTFGALNVLNDIAINTIKYIKELRGNKNYIDLDLVQIMKKEGEQVKDSTIIKGVIVDKEVVNESMPKIIKNAKIALINHSLEITKTEFDTDIRITDPSQIIELKKQEEQMIKKMIDKIAKTGANVVFCQKGIDDLAQYYLAKAGIFACRRVSKSDIELIARATGSKTISNINDLSPSAIGTASLIEELEEGNERFVYIKGCKNPKAVTIAIRGGSEHLLEEVERAIKDGIGDVIAAVKSGRVVAGGGAVEIELARRLRAFASTIQGREQLAIEEFANALEVIPEALAENAGLDQLEVITELKRKHESGMYSYGLNLLIDKIEDTFSAGIIEPLKVKTQAITAASEVASLILRIDDVLISKGSKAPSPVNEVLE